MQVTPLLQDRQPLKAVASLERAVAVRPDYAEGWTNLGAVLAGLNQYAGALAAFDKVLALEPRAEIWNERGLVLRALDRNDEALASFDRALALKPGFAGALNNRGVLFNDQKRFADALVNFDQVVILEPGNAEHLARQRLADLFLDTLPYGAHTTDSDALWCGVPLVTCLGAGFPGRVAAAF